MQRIGSRVPVASSLTLNQLEVFATVAREGSFTRAGEVLARSEAAISQQIKLLEASVGTRLLDRSPGRPVRLTAAGRVMLVSCETILHQLDRTIEELDALRRSESGSVLIGSGAYFGSYLLPQICGSFQHVAPGIRIGLRLARGVECVDAIRRGDVELAVIGGECKESGIATSYLAGKDVVWIAPADHRLAPRKRVPFTEILAEPLVLAPRTSSNRRMLDRWAQANGWALQPSFELSGVEAQVTAVLSGLGIAAVPSHVLGRHRDAAVSILSVEGFPLRGNWSVIWNADELSAAATAFRDHLLGQRLEIEESSLYAAEPSAVAS